MRVLVSGAGGMIGSVLMPALAAAGHGAVRLVRARDGAGTAAIQWDPEAGYLDAASLGRFDAVIHLAGENIASGRWTAEKKRRIRDSRVLGTRLLAETLARLDSPPQALLCASAVGFYGHRGDELLTEDSPPGKGFLADTCREWEAAAAPAREQGIRVAHLRFGVVLSLQGGALGRMLTPFRLGLGGAIGDGRQYVSWIAIDDAVDAVFRVLEDESFSGPVNAVGPEPVTNREFTHALGRALGRPTVVPLPAFAARMMFGEMADEALLASVRVSPARLLAAGFDFHHPRIEPALRYLLGQSV